MTGVVVAVLLALSASAGEREDALLSAVRKGDVAAVKALLDQGVPVDTRFRYDRTALSFAADRGNVELVKLLLERGADANSRDSYYKMTPVVAAAHKGHVEVARLLFARGATADDGVFFAAVDEGNVELLDLAIEHGKPRPELLSSGLEIAEKANAAAVAVRLREAGAVRPPKADFSVDAAVLARYSGRYQEDGKEQIITLSVADGALHASLGGPARRLSAIDAVTFRDVNARALVTLEVKLDGERVLGVTRNEIGIKRWFKRVEGQ
jgi:ankyrin repeat protein